jgi:hypothetical protein
MADKTWQERIKHALDCIANGIENKDPLEIQNATEDLHAIQMRDQIACHHTTCRDCKKRVFVYMHINTDIEGFYITCKNCPTNKYQGIKLVYDEMIEVPKFTDLNKQRDDAHKFIHDCCDITIFYTSGRSKKYKVTDRECDSFYSNVNSDDADKFCTLEHWELTSADRLSANFDYINLDNIESIE